MNFVVNLLIKHLWAAVVQNWGTTVSGIVGAILLAGPTLYHTYIEGHPINEVDLGLLGGAVWVLLVNAVRAKFSWGAVMGALLHSVPRAALVDMTKAHTGYTLKP
jgi:hypothetical protein